MIQKQYPYMVQKWHLYIYEEDASGLFIHEYNPKTFLLLLQLHNDKNKPMEKIQGKKAIAAIQIRQRTQATKHQGVLRG